ncbi:MAG: phosphatidate cytidylyltransferase [Gammaproteobacteria bacterium]|nr:phosphatidate cytidylyltransferase [Gammaproteobacteria bacterium]
MLKQRIITALILAVVFVGTIVFADTRWVSLLFSLVLFAAAREMLALTLKPSMMPAAIASAVFALLFWWSLTLITPQLVYWQSLAGVIIWVLITIGFIFYRHQDNRPVPQRAMMLVLGLVVLWISAHGVIYLHYVYGGWMLMYLLTLVWLADIGAYFSGRQFGKRKLAPSISPGKTWEGVYGGVCVNLVWMLLIYWLTQGFDIGLAYFLLIGVSTVLISIAGDLFESILKREAGVKDSGKLLPGHGGILDRIDSVIAASPVFVSGLLLA